jgi:hypothetical protein
MNGGKILALHVIDQDFVRHCIHQLLGTEEEIKKKVEREASGEELRIWVLQEDKGIEEWKFSADTL